MTLILGKPQATAYQMSQYLNKVNPNPKLSRAISTLEFCQLFLDVCAKEGVRGDIEFAQACKETGNFNFKGDVKCTQNNFQGLGATGGGNPGYTFPDIETGILAGAQHLKTYATKDPLNCTKVDPRRTTWFINAKGGTSPNVETLGGTWAVPGYSTKKYSSLEEANKAKDSYGYQIVNILNSILSIKEEDKKMSNSSLVTYTKISPNKTSPRNHVIDTVTVHCYVGQVTAESGCNSKRFTTHNSVTGASCNYVVGYDGSIGLCVAESDRSWCSSNKANDHRAITIEVACDTKSPYKVTDKAMAALIKLLADICRRNPQLKGGLKWRADKSLIGKTALQNMTVHRWFKNKACPGQYLYERHGWIADNVNKELGISTNFAKYDTVKVDQTTSTTGSNITSSVSVPTYTVKKGDTLSGIGNKVGVPWATIAKLNNLKSPYTLRVGQVLKLSDKTTTVSSNPDNAVNGVDYTPVFNSLYYASHNNDLLKAFGYDKKKLLNHFITKGMEEGRQACETFNVQKYMNRYSDLRRAFGTNLPKYYLHYIQSGIKEGRSGI